MTALAESHESQDAPAGPRTALRVGYAVLLLALVVPSLHSTSALWLDESLSVNIARLPVPDLFAALKQDGSPPLYYLLLHGWIGVFGAGAVAVRALSTLCVLAALPVAFAVGRRLGGERVAYAAPLLVAGCPFVVRYATETRMYALVVLLALTQLLTVLRALERPTWPRLGGVALVAGLLALTHYWSLFLVVTVEVLLLVRARREGRGGSALRVALALPAGAVLFLPWVPSFLFQAAHTGTPWAPPPTWQDATGTVRQWAGPGVLGLLLFVALAGLVAAGLTRSAGRWLAVAGLGALVLGLVVSRVQGSGYSLRYSAACVVPVLLTAALGTTRLPDRLVPGAVVGAVVLALSVAGFSSLLGSRTQAAATADAISSRLGPGDVVVYCPDQLGPAVDRLLPAGTHEVVYPTMGPPQRVDWVDYEQRNAAASPRTFAAQLDAATTGRIWLVLNDDYRTFGNQCSQLAADLTALRGGRTLVQAEGDEFEKEAVVGFPAPR